MRLPIIAAMVSCAVLLASADAKAQSAEDDDARYEWLLAELSRAQGPERTWGRIWMGTYAALAAGQGAVAGVVSDEGLRADSTVGAVKSALGFLAVLLTPRAGPWAASSLREMDGTTPQAKRLRRLRAEELLHRTAREQNFGTSWAPHIAAAITNLAGSFVLFHYYDRHLTGWVSLGTGMAVAEAQILTRPTGAISAWNRYLEAGDTVPKGPSAPTTAWSIVPGPGGLVLLGSF